MLMNLLSPQPGQPPITGSNKRLITGNYKSNGNLVSLKLDVVDFTDFQRNFCFGSPGPGRSVPHNHAITGTLFCHPETNTVRLNMNIVGPCNENNGNWPLHSPGSSSSAVEIAAKDGEGPLLKPTLWNTEILQQSILGTGSPIILGQHPQHAGGAESHHTKDVHQYSVYSAPVSPPSQPQDVPPPLLDFHSEQLMSEIQSMAFDIKDSSLSLPTQPFPLNTQQPGPPLVSFSNSNGLIEDRVMTTTARQPGTSQQQNHLVKQPFPVNLAPQVSFAASQPSAKSANITAMASSKPGSPSSGLYPVSISSHPTLLQPKLERSDSICSDYAPVMKEEFLTYTDELAGLDDLDCEANSLTPPSNISSPHIFSPIGQPSSVSGPEKNETFLNKYFQPEQHEIKDNFVRDQEVS